ncbi:hypothetical protein ANN_00436 [Periplaneta americana]|uniref:Uncharacterized protein n=1 Tax=Periplaneta americana TaxID=6978 RepID=A0ABQ8TTL1_PERAM|nr:hypothetical protein ANN_00436 [Periplaneta americana]
MAGLCEGGNEPPGYLKANESAWGGVQCGFRAPGKHRVVGCDPNPYIQQMLEMSGALEVILSHSASVGRL